MPFEGTLDFPVLFLITALNLFTLAYGLVEIAKTGELVSLRGSEQENVKMIALVFALVEATPGVLFMWCAQAPFLAERHACSVARQHQASRSQLYRGALLSAAHGPAQVFCCPQQNTC